MEHQFQEKPSDLMATHTILSRTMPEIRKIDTLFLRSLVILLLWLASPHLFAGVEAILSQQTTSMDQPVQLRLQIEGDQDLSPDLSVLEKDFEIISRSSQQSVSIINGKMSAQRSLSLTLLPKHTGTLSVPPIPVGNETTNPLTLKVTELPQDDVQQRQKQAWIELSLNKDSAYLEEEVLLTLKLYQAPGIRGETLEPPEASSDDTEMHLINEDRYTSEKEATEYRVLERVYALFPRQTGTLTLSGAKFRGHSGGSRDPLFSLFSNSFTPRQQTERIIRNESNSVSLEILPIPDAFTGKHWLPAKNLQIVETGIDNNAAALLAGKPITRRVMVIADGLMSNHLPAVEQQMPSGIKLYPESPHLDEKPSRSGISSSLQQNLTLIATDAGSYTLPALEIPWWNTETRQQEIARLPAREISFMPNPSVKPPAQNQDLTIVAQTESEAAVEAPATADPQQQAEKDFPWLATLLGLAWIVTVVAWWLSSRSKKAGLKTIETEPTQPLNQQEAMKTVLDQLATAYQKQDSELARMAWLAWAQITWPDNPPNNLTRLAKRCSPDLALAVNALERAIYSPTAQSSWSDYEVLKLIEARQSINPKPMDNECLLVPLNP
jgi:hypothetical protein